MKFKKILLKILVCIMTGLLLTSCGAVTEKKIEKKDTTTVKETPKKEVIITIGISQLSNEESELLDEILIEFQKKYSYIKVNKKVITNDYDVKIEAGIKAKNEPDVFYMDVSKFPEYVSKNYILPIDNYVDKADLNDFYTNLLSAFQKNGKTYGMPESYNVMALFYNKSILKKIEIDEPPKNWNELVKCCDKISKEDKDALVFNNNIKCFGTFILQAGGQIFENGKAVFTSQKAVNGFNFYNSLIKKKYAYTNEQLNEKSSINEFEKGKAAMCIENSSKVNYLEKNVLNVSYAVSALPKGAENANFIFTHAYAMGINCKHKKEAAELIKFISSEEVQNIVIESGIALPSRISMKDEYVEKYPDREALIEMIPYGEAYQFGVNHNLIEEVLEEAADTMISKKKPAKAVLTEAYKKQITNNR